MDALLAASDFIMSNADGASNHAQFEQMQKRLMSLFKKGKKEMARINQRELTKATLKILEDREKEK